MIGRTVTHYKILSKLGEGGMGVVYKAEDTTLKRTVAIKFLPEERTRDETARKRFIREAQAASALQHDNICTIHEVDTTPDGRMFICMDYYEGETLRERLARGPLSVEEAIGLAVQVASGLGEAHDRGMLHRDIKPENVFVTSRGVVKILDFGLAKLGSQTRVTKSGTTVGTVSYMSPEQVQGEELDPRSDIFSLGIMLHELLTGTTPFAADHEAAIMYKILNVAPPPLRDSGVKYAAQLQPVLGKMLAKDPGERYGDARDVIDDLSKIGVSDQTPARKRMRRQLIITTVVAGAVVAAAFGGWLLSGRDTGVHASEPRLAILYFENVTEPDDPERLGEVATNLLITGLSESQYLRVVSSQRLYDILKGMGREGAKVIGRDSATEVARRAGANEMLVGSILRAGRSVELTSQLIDVASGETFATQRVRAAKDEDIFSIVDRLSAEVKSDLDLPEATKREPDVRVADVTTSSPEAYRYYLEGNEYYNRYQWQDARASFRRAVALDSTFALAWLGLSEWKLVDQGGMPIAEHQEALAKAVAYAARATRLEARYIAVCEMIEKGDRAGAYTELGALTRAFPDDKRFYWKLYELEPSYRHKLAYLHRIVAADSLDKRAYNGLAYSYQAVGERDSAFWAIDRYLKLAPGEPNPYDTQGDLYGVDGQIEKAIESYRKATEIDSTYGTSWEKLGHAYMERGDETTARACWRKLLRLDARSRSVARYHLALIPLYYGKAGETLEALEKAIAEDERDVGHASWLGAKYAYVGYFRARSGDAEGARNAFNNGSGIAGEVGLSCLILLAEVDPSGAEKELARWRRWNPPVPYLAIAEAALANSQGQYDAAWKAVSDGTTTVPFLLRFERGIGALGSKRFPEAVADFEYCRDSFNGYILALPHEFVRVHFYLGQAYEATGETARAIAEYEDFIERWKDADSVFIGEVEDARSRLAKLRG